MYMYIYKTLINKQNHNRDDISIDLLVKAI